jgi:hypothetical protein
MTDTHGQNPGNPFDLACPHCGRDDRIDIQASVWIRLCPDGTDPYDAENGDHEWCDASAALCNACLHEGTVASFTKEDRDNG